MTRKYTFWERLDQYAVWRLHGGTIIKTLIVLLAFLLVLLYNRWD